MCLSIVNVDLCVLDFFFIRSKLDILRYIAKVGCRERVLKMVLCRIVSQSMIVL